MMVIDYYFSVLSDWAYMGGERLEQLARRYQVRVNHMPMRLGMIYANTGGILLQKRSKQRQDYRVVELERWRDHLGIPIELFPKHYPTDDQLSSCMIIAAKRSGSGAGLLANAILRAIWAENRDISDRETLKAIADGLGMDGVALLNAASETTTIAEFDRFTHEGAGRGVFGSPFYFFQDEIFWGQDRLQFLENCLRKATARFDLPTLISTTEG
jgi:2-hydroxychromene-2-carboxylate isomerase